MQQENNNPSHNKLGFTVFITILWQSHRLGYSTPKTSLKAFFNESFGSAPCAI